MIVFELICTDRHRFEGWFASNEDFERQHAGGLLSCPQCGEGHVQKLPAAKIKTTGDAPQATIAAEQAFLQFIEAVFNNSEDVGTQFAEEARRIHYEEAPQRNIRGLASAEENAALRDEGIAVMVLPLPPRDKMN